MTETEREAVLIYPRDGEKAEDLLAVMTLIGFETEATTVYGD
jgi:hypothetical protein